MKRIKTLIVFLLVCICVSAEDIVIDSIGYSVISMDSRTLAVSKVYKKAPIVSIPAIVSVHGRDFSVTRIGEKAFYDLKIKKVELPETIEEIYASAFGGCFNLTSINLPHSVKSIGEYAFHDCKKLHSIKLPKSLIEIERSIFSWCEGITELNIPAGVFRAKGLFYTDKILTKLIIEDSPTTFEYSYDNNLMCNNIYIGRNVRLHHYISVLNEVVIGKGVTLIEGLEIDKAEKIIVLTQNPPVFSGISNAAYLNTEVIVPRGSLEVYQQDTNWGKFFNLHEEDSPLEKCQNPTISLNNNLLKVSSTTNQSCTYYTITSRDTQYNGQMAGAGKSLTGLFDICAHAEAPGYLPSDNVTATICWNFPDFSDKADKSSNLSNRPLLISPKGEKLYLYGTKSGDQLFCYGKDGKLIESQKPISYETIINKAEGGFLVLQSGDYTLRIDIK